MNSRTKSVIAFCALILVAIIVFLFIYLKEIIYNREKRFRFGCHGVSQTGIHEIGFPNINPFPVLCDVETDNKEWMVIENRYDGTENFNRSWFDYRNGFGYIDMEFFIGLDLLHRITNTQQYQLYIHIEDYYGQTQVAMYDHFRVGNEEENYVLESLGKFTGTAEEKLINWNIYQPFSTYDRDNDQHKAHNCALDNQGGWWYKYCGGPNPNGVFPKSGDTNYSAMTWNGYTPIKNVYMLIRPHNDD